MDVKADSVAWSKAAKVDLTANWDGVWSGHPTADITSTARLLWTTDTLFVFAQVEDFEPFHWGPDTTEAPYKGEQLFVSVDGTHARDTVVDDNWAGWPENAPDKGPVCYKVWRDGITLNWGGGGSPEDSGWVRGKVFVDTTNYVWGVMMAIYVPQIGNNAEIGFNIGGANASLAQATADTANHDGAYAYYSWLSAEYPGGDVFHNSASFGSLSMIMVTAVGAEPVPLTLPARFALEQNYPNPFNPSTQIAYALPQSAKVSLRVYNLLGQEVARLVDGVQPAGQHVAPWNAGNLGSGMYFYRLTVDDHPVATRKMVLVK
jgi:hypothetical protein